MNREEALALLTSGSATLRLAAARELYSSAGLQDLSAIDEALVHESDSYTRRALARVKVRLGPATSREGESQPDRLIDAAVRDEIRAQQLEEVSKVIIHELGPTVGFLATNASRELKESYETSDTRRLVERLQDYLGVLDELNVASAPPRYEEVNLSDVVALAVGDAELPEDQVVHLGRFDSVVTRVDPGRLRLALRNVIKNAAEACVGTGGSVVVN